MSLEQTIGNLEIRYANVVTFVGSSNTMVDTTTGRIQTKGIQHNSNVITDVSGPHGRIAPTLKKYPEIAFGTSKVDRNDTTNTYVQAGYTVTASSYAAAQEPYRAFDYSGSGGGSVTWTTASITNLYGGGSGLYGTVRTSNLGLDTGGTATPQGGTRENGEWITLQIPNKITLSSITISRVDSDTTAGPKDFQLYGSNDGTTWVQILSVVSADPSTTGTSYTLTSTPVAYTYFGLVVTRTISRTDYMTINDLIFYGTEENPPAGDHSVDTTFKSRFNNPQLTGVQVLVDGATGVGTNQISGGPDPSGNDAPMTSPNKYWTLNGTLTSNLAVEANTFLEGDQPHAVSVWFNSSNLEANVSNTCVFSIASEEKLDSVNLDLQSNTWHNLTYAYQGEGGSKVTYLDGRKVSEDQAEDTFGDYPPFAMTGYSQGGYVASASSEYITTPQYRAWEAFNDITASDFDNWTSGDFYGANGGDGTRSTVTWSGSTNHNGEFIKLELPHKLIVNYVKFVGRQGSGVERQLPRAFTIIGSNDDVNWETIHQETRTTNPSTGETHAMTGVSKHKGFKYIALVPKNSGTTNTNTHISIGNISYYGHRENDLVRLPDPTNVLKYPHIAMTGPAQRGYVASASSLFNDGSTSDYQAWKPFDGSISNNLGAWLSDNGPVTYSTSPPYNAATVTGNSLSGITGGVGSRDGAWLKLELPHKIKLSEARLYGRNAANTERIDAGYIYGSNDDTNWTQIGEISASGISSGNLSTYTDTVPLVISSTDTTNSYKYFIVQPTSLTHANGYAGIGQMEYYGTGVDSIPIQIGGGNIDKVANFRVYDKFIDQNQALEIWNAQKEEFGRAKPQMVLQQGKLGIGTDAPQGSLSVADEPDPTTYGLQEFPPKPLVGYKTHIEGHGDFRIHYSGNHSSGPILNAFNKKAPVGDFWYSATNSYEGANNLYSLSAVSPIGIEGEWMYMTLPYHVDMKSLQITARNGEVTSAPKTAVIFGSADWGVTWEQVGNWSDKTSANHWLDGGMPSPAFTINSNKSLNSIGFVVTHGQGSYAFTLGEIKFFGYREQVTKQSVLHDGQLTLTKSLNVPRIGPDLDADDTPRRDRLVVEYNTSADPTFEGAVRDTSGRGNDGMFYGGASYDEMNKAITLSDGTDDYVESGKTIIARGTPQHTFSFWVKPSTEDHDDTSTHYIMVWGSETAQNKWSAVALSNDGRLAHVYHASAKRTIDQILPAPGAWYHVVVVVKSISATTAANRDVEFYIDGELYTGNYDAFGSQNNSTSYYLDWGSGTHTSVRLGSLHSASEDSSSSLSTIKLYDTALTAQEVEKLYDMGRLGNGLYPLHIDAPVHINGPLYAPGTILNITQSFFDGGFTTTSGNLQNVFTTDWVSMRKNSKVEVDLSVLYRNDGTAWGGMYLVAWFMVDVPVGSVAADTWVAYVTPGYHMTYYQEIPEYGNTSYLPFNIPTDFKIRFLLQMKPYNSGTTLHINRDHHLWFENASFANLRQFIPITTKRYEQGHNTRGSTYYNGHTGGTKFIIKEIAGL